MHEGLLRRLEDRSARIGVIGMGYVGLPLALRFADVGYSVIGFDIDASKVNALNASHSYLVHISPDRVLAARQRGFEATADLSRVASLDAIVICVPTPLNRHREPDLSFVTGTVESLLPYLKSSQVLSLESTTYPGTTEEEIQRRVESGGWVVGTDIYLCYSPEREDPGNVHFPAHSIPKICSGVTPQCLIAGMALYKSAFDQVIPVSSTRVAEMTKLHENIYRAVNVGLVNEMKIICDRMGIDVREVIGAAATKPFGFAPYWPGPGLGGHCIPIDPFYLTWKAREYGVHTRFIELAGEINRMMPEWVIGKVMSALNDRGKAVNGSRCLILGVAYKKNVNDLRESPAVELMELLREKGAVLDYSDPHVPIFPRIRNHHFDLKSVSLTSESLESYDVVLIATDHDAVDYALVQAHAKLIVDTRGVYATSRAKHVIAA